jgi:hypothetical protein
MARHSFLYVLFFCLLIGCSWIFAQYSSAPKNNDKKDRCGEYKMPFVLPSNKIEYKSQTAKPRGDIDFKGKVVDPCKKPDAKS